MVKSAIKVFCRIKPSTDNVVYSVNSESYIDDKSTIELMAPKLNSDGYVNNRKESHLFGFEKIFEQKTTQQTIFDEAAKSVIDNVLHGYNGTIFAYGQTGSGKTFTITGGVDSEVDRGIIPRALSYIFQKYKEEPNKIHKTEVSYLEIYNECGYDLLDPNLEATKLEDLTKVTLMEDNDQNIHLRNMSVITADTEEDALNLLFLGDTNRMVAETPMNQASTRSHCIFTIHVTSREPGSAKIKTSKLHIVDLAGSERVAKTKSGGHLLTEVKYINLSLHFLEQVIVALSEKKRQHIPYRNSMMTSVLRDSLGGNCMTTMIATISVKKPFVEESITTCKFAQRVAMIKNEAILNEELDPKLMVAKLKREVQSLKRKLQLRSGMEQMEDLTPDETNKLEEILDDYIETNDAESLLELGGDMRKINYCFSRLKTRLKNRCLELRNAKSLMPPTTGCGDMSVVKVVLDDQQVNRLREILEQRDQEILTLVNMLKKTRKKTQNTSPTSTPMNRRNNVAKNHHRKTKDSVAPSMDKQEAYETFLQSTGKCDSLEDLRKKLETRYSQANDLVCDTNQIRDKLNDLKKRLDATKNKTFQIKEEFDENNALSDEVEELKRKYQSSLTQLKAERAELSYLHNSYETNHYLAEKQFEEWWLVYVSMNVKLL